MAGSLIKKVIVAVNGSVSSEKAAMYAVMFCRQVKASLKVVNVVDTATINQLLLAQILIPEEREKYTGNLRTEGENTLRHIKELAASKGLNIETEMREGAVWSELVACAGEYKADLIVVGAHRHYETTIGGTRHKDYLSAINHEILNNADCNIIVVKDDDADIKFRNF